MKKVTAADVAKAAGVSQTTVSAVLTDNQSIVISDPTRQRVIQAAKKLKYGPFDNTRFPGAAKNQVILMVPTMANPYYPEALDLLESLIFEYKYRPLICCTNKSTQKETEFLESLDLVTVRAIIYLYTPQARRSLNRLAKTLPVCVLGELDYDLNCLNIALDSEKAGYMAMEHLWNLGHRAICFVSNPVNNLSLSRKLRLDGIIQFAKEHDGLQSLYINTAENLGEQDEWETGKILTEKLLSEHREITAVIAANDMTAMGAFNAIHELKLSIPRDVAVMGFDNIVLSGVCIPHLTTVDHHIYDRAKLAISTLFDDKRKPLPKKIIYEPTLVVRQSTKKE